MFVAVLGQGNHVCIRVGAKSEEVEAMQLMADGFEKLATDIESVLPMIVDKQSDYDKLEELAVKAATVVLSINDFLATVSGGKKVKSETDGMAEAIQREVQGKDSVPINEPLDVRSILEKFLG